MGTHRPVKRAVLYETRGNPYTRGLIPTLLPTTSRKRRARQLTWRAFREVMEWEVGRPKQEGGLTSSVCPSSFSPLVRAPHPSLLLGLSFASTTFPCPPPS